MVSFIYLFLVVAKSYKFNLILLIPLMYTKYPSSNANLLPISVSNLGLLKLFNAHVVVIIISNT